MSLIGILQNILTFVTSTLGLTLVSVALVLTIAAVLCHMMSWRHFFETVAAGAILMTIAATASAVFG